jgi:hypothetical protein
MPRLEETDLLCDVGALGRRRRADDDQSMRGIECRERLVGQSVSRREVVAVAKDGAQALGDRAYRGLATDKVLVDAKAFQSTMQPLGPAGIGVAVGDEGAVFVGDGLCHCCFDPMLEPKTAPGSIMSKTGRRLNLQFGK